MIDWETVKFAAISALAAFFISVIFSILLFGCNFKCEKCQATNETIDATYSSIKKNILPKCLICHAPGSEGAQWDFSSYEAILATGLVIPEDAKDSDFLGALKAGRMPKGGAKLSDNEIAAVETWINSGALNN